MKTASVPALAVLCLFAACKKDPEPLPSSPFMPPATPGASLSASPAGPSSAALPQALPLGVTWEDPTGWQRSATNSPMRKATYKVPHAGSDAEDAELAVFYFGPGQGGSIDANVDRWVKQFADVLPTGVRRDNRTANGLRQHTVEIENGTYASGMPGGPTQTKPGYAMLGGIVEAPSGAYFFKLTGPAATVKASRAAFYKMLDSVKPTV